VANGFVRVTVNRGDAENAEAFNAEIAGTKCIPRRLTRAARGMERRPAVNRRLRDPRDLSVKPSQ